jgi:large subunit ribosomal protein L22
MEVKAIYKYARISSQKAREVTRAIQGLSASQALATLNYTPKKAALLIGKTLQSAIANATNNHDLNEEALVVKSCTATDGPTLKRIMPRARGSASPILKRMAHITVILSDEA